MRCAPPRPQPARLPFSRLLQIYYIVGGAAPGQGAVITRDRPKAHDVWSLEPGAPGGWYRLQTNYDHWNPPPAADDRRNPGYKLMDAMGERGLSKQRLLDVMFTWPVFNHHTDFTALFLPHNSTYLSMVWTD